MHIKDAKNAMLGAVMDVQQVFKEFQSEWVAPEIRRTQAVMEKALLDQWDANLPAIEAMEAQNPEVFNKAKAQIAEIRKRSKGGITPPGG